MTKPTMTRLERELLAWFAQALDAPELQDQCARASVLARTVEGPAITVRLTTTSRRPLDFHAHCLPHAPAIVSPLLPGGAYADLWLRAGFIHELHLTARAGQEFPFEMFEFELLARDPQAG